MTLITPPAQDCRGLFCFIGAVSATAWLRGVEVDDNGFVLTDSGLDGPRLVSTKRVAGAVGEGASAVRSVHLVLGSVGV
jgi:thioredoxin reductase (NADPH)